MSARSFFHFQYYKSKLFLVTAIVVFTGIIFSAFTEKKTPLQQTTSYCLENIKLFQSELDTFQQLTEQTAEREQLISRFRKTRIAFKRFEFMAEYVDVVRYPFFNGVNAVEMDDGYDPSAKPEGLQVIESELYNGTIDIGRITFLIKQLKYRTLSFYLILRDAELRDTHILEAIRFHLIRMETLNLVSFDSPDVRNNAQEISTALSTLNTVLSFYANDKNAPEITPLQKIMQSAVTYLNAKNFLTLDRLFFIKNYIQPITAACISIQTAMSVPYLDAPGKMQRAVNLRTKSIYDTDFINAKFYAQDKYYKSNALYTAIGKKLFFDKRLSADGSMSCASCHQPDNFFTDKLPNSITNKTGEFQKRNTPTILNAALQEAYFYDLAATSLETQIDHVVVNPLEYNHNYDEILKRLKTDTGYMRLFTTAFSELSNDALSVYTIRVCLADFERQFVLLNSPFDKYMRGQTTTIDASVKRGFNLFMGKAQCGSCHFAPTFFGTTPPFYNFSEAEVLGIIKTFDTIKPLLDDDIGRFKNFELEQFKFAMKTSTVRNAELTAPYMHNGGFKTLDEVIEFYNRGGGAGLGLNIPNQTLAPDKLNLTKQDKKDIISFIKALTDTSSIKSLL